MAEREDEPTVVESPAEADGSAAVDETTRLARIIESILFASATPMPVRRLVEVLEGPSNKQVQAALNLLQQEYMPGVRGIQLQEVGGGYQFRTARENAEWVRAVFREKPTRLGRAALETLAVIAYKQPVTKAEIEIIRGVDVDGTLTTLLGRRLIKIAGRKEAVGRPLLYATAPEFLEAFGLKDLQDLPSLKELGAASESEDGETKLQSSAAGEGADTAYEEFFGDASAAPQLELETTGSGQRAGKVDGIAPAEAERVGPGSVAVPVDAAAVADLEGEITAPGEARNVAQGAEGSTVGVEATPAQAADDSTTESAAGFGASAEDSQPSGNRIATKGGRADSGRSGARQRSRSDRAGDEGEPADGSDHR